MSIYVCFYTYMSDMSVYERERKRGRCRQTEREKKREEEIECLGS